MAEDSSVSCHSTSLSLSIAPDLDPLRDIKDDEGDTSSSVKVVVRVRPICPSEVGYDQCIDTLTSSSRCRTGQLPDIVRIGGENGPSFGFDFVFSPKSTQRDIFTIAVMPLLESCLDGYNATILAYGQTGSGKTYTVFGPSNAKSFDDESRCANSSGTLSEAGLIPRALRTVFSRLDKLKSTGASAGNSATNYEYEVRLQFLELYGEDIFDLLSSSSTGKLSIRDGGPLIEPEVIGATELKVATAEDALLYLTRGALRRITGATAMNAESSRSHAIMTLIIEQTHSFQGSVFEGEEFATAGLDTETKRSKFHFVDLAGSERQKRSLAFGLRLKEGININKGLLVLGNVISALGDPNKKGKVFVPYRDSKLTRLLKGSLGGNHKTLMIACVSPSSSNMEESLNCLRYANRAKNIQNQAVVNADTGSSLLFAMRNLLKALATELLGLKKSNDESATAFSHEQLLAMSQGKITFDAPPQISLRDTSQSYKILQKQKKFKGSQSGVLVASVLSDVSSESFKQKKTTYVDDGRFQRVDPALLYERGDDNTLNSCERRPMSQTIALQLDSEKSHLEIITEKYLQMTPDIHISLSQEFEVEENSAMSQENSENIDPGDNFVDGEFLQIQKNIQKDMSALSQSIATKEQFIEELEKSQQKYELMRNHYETKLTELGLQLSIFEAERENMIKSLNSNDNDFDASQNIKMNISEKEHQISALKKRQTKLATLSKSSVQSRHVIDSLKSEVESLKRQKADLQRKLLMEQSLHFQEVSKLKKEAATHEREAERSRVDLHRLLKEKEQTERVAKMRSDEISRLRLKYRDIDKKKRMLTLKRGVMDKVGIDLVLLGRSRVDRKIPSNNEIDSTSSSLPTDIDFEGIRSFIDSKVADISKKEACADKLAHAWEDHLELILRRDELNESSLEERDAIQEQLDDINIQILYKEEIIRALAKGLGDRPEQSPTGEDLFRHILKDRQLVALCPSLAPSETCQLLSKILFGMLVRERRRVAALARAASTLDQKLVETTKWAESQESTLKSQLEEEKMQKFLLTKRQQEQISSLMELAQMEKASEHSDGDPNLASSNSDSMIMRLANERIIALEALLAGYQCDSQSHSSQNVEEKKIVEEKRPDKSDCERLRNDAMSLRAALLQIRTVMTASSNSSHDSSLGERDTFKDRAICKIINDALQSSTNCQSESKSFGFGDRSVTMMELLNSNDEESTDELPDWVDDIMEDLAIIARGEPPPSIKKIKIPDVIFSTHKQKSVRMEDTPSRKMTRLNSEPSTEYTSVFERLQSPSNYTGVQKQVHDELRRRQLEKKSAQSELKQRTQSEVKRRILENIEAPSKTMSTPKALEYSDVFKRLQEKETKSYSYARKAANENDTTSSQNNVC